MQPFSAKIHFNSQGTPVADAFDDVYFSNDSGINETRHVFIDGNDLPEKWLNCKENRFVIGETGLGTGLNCLVVMQEFQQFRQQNPEHPLQYLHIISTEKFPIAKNDLIKALSSFAELKHFVEPYIEQYPMAIQGCHRLHFDKFNTVLDIWIGDVKDTLPQWHNLCSGLIDAWFLDGFAPSKNPEMWTQTLFDQMARLSKIGSTFATFTAAGVVKRGLQQAGFSIAKRKGFGRKRDMLTGEFDNDENNKVSCPPYYRYRENKLDAGEHVVVVGAGLAGVSTAYALVRKGLKVTLIDKQSSPAKGASGNPQGGFYPQLHADASHPARIQAHGFTYAKSTYSLLLKNGFNFECDFCGTALVGFNDTQIQRHNQLIAKNNWPNTLVSPLSADEMATIAGVPLPYSGLFIEDGGWISPPHLINAILKSIRQIGEITEMWSTQIENIENNSNGVTLSLSNGTFVNAKHLVLATGHHAATQPWFSNLPLRPVRGQVERIPTDANLAKLKTVLCHKGYLTPKFEEHHALGSTYVKGDLNVEPRADESIENIEVQQRALNQCEWIHKLTHHGQARASIRLSTPDHQPLVGQCFDNDRIKTTYSDLKVGKPLDRQPLNIFNCNMSMIVGLGSRGLTTAPLLAEILASELTHSPLPMENDLLQALAPQRFTLRNLIRNKD